MKIASQLGSQNAELLSLENIVKMALARAPTIDKYRQKHMFSVKMKPVQPNNSSLVESSALGPLMDQKSGKAEENTLDEINKQIFCTI